MMVSNTATLSSPPIGAFAAGTKARNKALPCPQKMDHDDPPKPGENVAFNANCLGRVSSFDFKMCKQEQVRQSVMEKLKKHGKGIVLVHNCSGFIWLWRGNACSGSSANFFTQSRNCDTCTPRSCDACTRDFFEAQRCECEESHQPRHQVALAPHLPPTAAIVRGICLLMCFLRVIAVLLSCLP